MKTALVKFVLSCLVAALPLTGGDIRVGVAAVDITPPLGMPMAGYYHERGADGVLDPLYSKAMVIEAGGERVALVTLDIISVTRQVTDRARLDIERATGIRGTAVMISATHAHTGPELVEGNRSITGPGAPKPVAIEYTEALPERIASSVREANTALQPAVLRAAQGRCEGLAFNRRFFMRDGTVGWNPGKLNPNLGLPAGPTDPGVGVLHVASPGGDGPSTVRATYVSFAMHPDTTGGTRFSADWPGALGRVLAGYHGPNHLTLVANGTCGNLNHLDFHWAWPQGGPGEQNRIATILGAAVFQTCKSLKPVAPGPLRARSETVELALPDVTPQEVAEAKATIETTRDDRGGNFMKQVRAHRVLDIAAREGRPHQVEVQAIALGQDLAWVGLPGEIFVELGLAVKRRSPFNQTFVVELANEDVGYVPDRRSYAEGNYEPESARCAAGSGERLVDAAVRLLEALHAQDQDL